MLLAASAGTGSGDAAAAQTLAGAEAPAAAPTAGDSAPIAVPSGATVTLLEVIDDVPGPAGATLRYRFVMPKLAELVPVTAGDVGEELTPEDMAELDRLGETAPGDAGTLPPSADAEALADAELVSPEDLNLPDFKPEDFVTDPGSEAALDQPMAVPADPDFLLQDPVHEDITWLCNDWILPRLRGAPPAQIIISMADRPTRFGEFDPGAVQLFEAFSVTPDRSACVWEPW